jgi:ClpP class serine protease
MPIYTFAEDYALDAGFLLLMAGKEVYANPFTLVGDVGKSYKTYYIGRLLQKFNLELKQYPSGESCVTQMACPSFPSVCSTR